MLNSRDWLVQGRSILVSGRWIRIAHIADEWHEDVEDPGALIHELKQTGPHADLFTFWQRPPHATPRFAYHLEPDPVAMLSITTYDNWLYKQINNKTRNLVLKAQKRGVVVGPASFDDQFIHGVVRIFNESPIRQGMPFPHYGKTFETIKRDFSRYLFREDVFGAYVNDELIGFMFLVNAGHFAMLGQIISMIRDRDKSPNNALVAKAVEVCAERHISRLTYAGWPREGSLRDFKRHNGFECIALPRYYVPLTLKGRAALALHLHRTPMERVPDPVLHKLKDIRSSFYTWRYRARVG